MYHIGLILNNVSFTGFAVNKKDEAISSAFVFL